ncbi:ferritin-like domain-containing protein [Salinisphaera sp. SPP-AMP-43]|uniref:ferritin-like domain-containing protein n=1 Tax=Salinisphaera sp. SPP-AMP-43 TaxID=3121288 RepID=UPI003C6E5783
MNNSDVSVNNPEIIDATTGRPVSRSRRRFLANSGMYTAGLVGSALLGACSDDDNTAIADDGNDQNTVVINGPSDQAVLNFALNLEYLEAEFYLRAVTGSGLQDRDISGNGNAGDVTGGSQVDFGGEALIGRYAAEIAADELHHVQFLRSALGDGAVARPAINLQSSFQAAAAAAFDGAGVTPPDGFTFNPFASPLQFLLGAFIFEDVGVTAYKGGAAYIRDRDYLTAAAGILSVEGYHAGLVRTLLTGMGDQVVFQDQGSGSDITVGAIVDAISDARDSLDGDSDDDQGIASDNDSVTLYGTDYEASNIVPTDGHGITFSRTPQQVHNIAYLTRNAVGPSMGSVPEAAFFPAGTNGMLTESGDQNG